MHEFSREAEILHGQKKAEEFEKNRGKKVCDWKDDREVALLRASNRAVERKKKLDIIVGNRVCPRCRRHIYLDSGWVIEIGEGGGEIAFCRSCFHSRESDGDEGIKGGFIQGIAVVRFEVDGWKIKSLRGVVGVGQGAFAQLMGWTRGYQHQLESGMVKSLSIEVVEKLVEVFESIGVEITDAV